MYFDIKPKNTDVIKGDQIDPNQYVEVSKSLMKKFPKAKKIITTLRGSINASNNLWSGVLYDGEKAFFSKKCCFSMRKPCILSSRIQGCKVRSKIAPQFKLEKVMLK